MSTPTKPLLSRKDIAQMIPVISPRMVADNERRWGLDKARVRDITRPVCYRTALVILILRQRGFID